MSTPGLQSLHAESVRVFGISLTAEQVACYTDPARRIEALAMLDDMEARLGFDVDGARRELRGPDVPEHADFVGGFASMADFGEYLVDELRDWSDTPESDFLDDFRMPNDSSRIDYAAYAEACTLAQNGCYVIVWDRAGILVYDVG